MRKILNERVVEINHFYEILQELENRTGGKLELQNCNGKMKWPTRGVYFFFEPGENRDKTSEPRVVRIGTHALKFNSKTTLWNRLRQHRGSADQRGNHRGSIFRCHIGTAIINKEKLQNKFPNWNNRLASREIRQKETPMEKRVSNYIGKMPFIVLSVNDVNGSIKRSYIEKNSITLLSNFEKIKTSSVVDPPSEDWLGYHCSNGNVKLSGLWNHNHVQHEKVHPEFLNTLEKRITTAG